MQEIKLGNRYAGKDHPPFVIAEMSGNHNQSLDRALELTEAAAKAGAHALKLQTFTADTITLDVDDGDFFISDKKSLWEGTSLHKLYQKAYTPWEWHEELFELSRSNLPPLYPASNKQWSHRDYASASSDSNLR